MVEQARRNGARLIVIDPYRTRTAALADWHIAIRPGTDGALALGLMHVILNEGLEDRAYIDEMTHGYPHWLWLGFARIQAGRAAEDWRTQHRAS